MIIASVATYEKRADHLRDPLESILKQGVFDRVLVMVGSSDLADRISDEYQDLPVEACVVPEIGPGKKHLASLVCDAADRVVTFDDDRVYPSGYARLLLEGLAFFGKPTGLLGYLATSPLIAVQRGDCDLLHGEYGWAYEAGWIPVEQVVELGRRPELFAHDDAYLGYLLSTVGVRCHVVADVQLARGVKTNPGARRAGSLGMSGDARQRFFAAMQATWWSDGKVRVGRPIPSPESFAQ